MTEPTPNQTTTILRFNLDLNSSQKLTNVPSNGKNYVPWAKAAKVTFRGKDMLGYINGNKIRPIFEAKAQEEWDMYDSQVMTLITNPLEHQLSETSETAPELWQEIEN
jgi:gag-polypeptide of LTR copia-type